MVMILDQLLSREITVDGLSFTISPEDFQAFAHGLAASMASSGLDDQGRAYMASGLSLIERITAWTGVELPDGKPAPCTRENKMRLFGMRPDLLNAIGEQLRGKQESAEKNLPTLPDGSDGATGT